MGMVYKALFFLTEFLDRSQSACVIPGPTHCFYLISHLLYFSSLALPVNTSLFGALIAAGFELMLKVWSPAALLGTFKMWNLTGGLLSLLVSA